MQVTKLFSGRLIISTKKIAWWFIKFRLENPLAANRNCLNHFTVRMITFIIARLSLFRAEACNFIKKSLWHRYFPVNFAEFLRTPFLQNTSERLLLNNESWAIMKVVIRTVKWFKQFLFAAIGFSSPNLMNHHAIFFVLIINFPYNNFVAYIWKFSHI